MHWRMKRCFIKRHSWIASLKLVKILPRTEPGFLSTWLLLLCRLSNSATPARGMLFFFTPMNIFSCSIPARPQVFIRPVDSRTFTACARRSKSESEARCTPTTTVAQALGGSHGLSGAQHARRTGRRFSGPNIASGYHCKWSL